MGDARFTARLVRRARLVPEHVGDYGRAMVLDNDDFKAVFKGVLGDAVF